MFILTKSISPFFQWLALWSQENTRSFDILYYNYSIYLTSNNFSIFIHGKLKAMPIKIMSFLVLACQTIKVYEH